MPRRLFSAENANSKISDAIGRDINADPLLDIGMRLGEGTGAMVAYPLLRSAMAFMNEMASFESAGVSKNVR